jgi:hypothetical protein
MIGLEKTDMHQYTFLRKHNIVNSSQHIKYPMIIQQTHHTVQFIPSKTFPRLTLEQDIVTSKYRSLVGSLLWLAYATRPNLCVTTSLLDQYNKQPSSGHFYAARHVLTYILGTIYHGLRFTHKPNTTLVNFIGFVPPPNTFFSYANWGPQNESVPTASQPPIHIDTNYNRSLY